MMPLPLFDITICYGFAFYISETFFDSSNFTSDISNKVVAIIDCSSTGTGSFYS